MLVYHLLMAMPFFTLMAVLMMVLEELVVDQLELVAVMVGIVVQALMVELEAVLADILVMAVMEHQMEVLLAMVALALVAVVAEVLLPISIRVWLAVAV
jgi:hypothetical protein